MSDRTSIEWTGATWNPIKARRKDTGKVGWHCERVSEACRFCYAAAMNHRNLPGCGTGLDYTRTSRDLVDIFTDEKALLAPLKWKRPRKVFVCSMTDLFGEFVPFELVDRVFAVMALAGRHAFQVLTKRPDRMAEYFVDLARRVYEWDSGEGETEEFLITTSHDAEDARPLQNACREWLEKWNARHMGWPLPNVWLGTTVENQEWADKRIPWLLKCPAAVRFLSVEPMLGPVDLSAFMGGPYVGLPGDCVHENYNFGIGWTICGGESGRNARPMHPDWARSLRDQCATAGVPFFFKQWGSWVPHEGFVRDVHGWFDGDEFRLGQPWNPAGITGARCMRKASKKAAGRLLDGIEHSEFPAAPEPAV